MELHYLKVKDTEHDQWSNQKLLHHFQHTKNQLHGLIILEMKQILDSQDLNCHLFNFPDTMYEHAKNQLNSFIHF